MVTALYAGLLGFLFILLSVNVIRGRRAFGIPLLDGNQEDLRRRIRAHGNFAEYTAFFLIALGLAEINALPALALHALGIAFVGGRLTHAYGILRAEHLQTGKLVGGRYRAAGMACTFFTISTLSAYLLAHFFYLMIH